MRPILDVPSAGHKPKLLDQVRDVIRRKHYSIRTEQAYVDWIKRFILFHGKRHPVDLDRKAIPGCTSREATSTARRGPWKLIYYEAYLEQADALGRERYLKSGAGRRFLKAQLGHYLRKNPIRSR